MLDYCRAFDKLINRSIYETNYKRKPKLVIHQRGF